ncbi:hypothetical protein Goari_022587 [Gossypium aridum]|uniref:Uncharacterized protein n=1 Tax=Gossypium aridum TaxID=34290 RepID=A0A7J8YTH6_GOSAI|nr:hypothetical protein [Gossypium aridum]
MSKSILTLHLKDRIIDRVQGLLSEIPWVKRFNLGQNMDSYELKSRVMR